MLTFQGIQAGTEAVGNSIGKSDAMLDLSASSINGDQLLAAVAAAVAAVGEQADGGVERQGQRGGGSGWHTVKMDRCSQLRSIDMSLFIQSSSPALTRGLTSLSMQGLKGCGGRLPPHIDRLTSLRSLDASSCGLSRSLDRQLLALTRLTDLVLSGNDISDLHTGGVLKGQLAPLRCI